VLLRTGEGWRIVQYNLALPIPNELFGGIASEIAEYYEAVYSGP
jgi:hypothetical protein